jgi:hypothetical protein
MNQINGHFFKREGRLHRGSNANSNNRVNPGENSRNKGSLQQKLLVECGEKFATNNKETESCISSLLLFVQMHRTSLSLRSHDQKPLCVYRVRCAAKQSISRAHAHQLSSAFIMFYYLLFVNVFSMIIFRSSCVPLLCYRHTVAKALSAGGGPS